MKIAVLTSSRADYGIYLPLLQKMKKDSFFELEIIAFGTHVSKFHGYTLEEVQKGGYNSIHTISSLLTNDDASAIATSYGLTVLKFAEFWSTHTFDLVLCLGDRYEMSAAVQAGIPFGIKFAHIHGGETTLGAIDNVYRHQISLASEIHFTATDVYAEKVKELTNGVATIVAVGSISLDELFPFSPVERSSFFKKYSIPDVAYALVTFHPETVASEENNYFAIEMNNALKILMEDLFLVITMPNADTLGTIYRRAMEELKEVYPDKVLLIENFGKDNYFNAMHYSSILIGNSSSGIIEAASFGKYVVNVGNRQQGRMQSANTLNANFDRYSILNTVKEGLKLRAYKGSNVYYKEGATDAIIKILKEHAKL